MGLYVKQSQRYSPIMCNTTSHTGNYELVSYFRYYTRDVVPGVLHGVNCFSVKNSAMTYEHYYASWALLCLIVQLASQWI